MIVIEWEDEAGEEIKCEMIMSTNIDKNDQLSENLNSIHLKFVPLKWMKLCLDIKFGDNSSRAFT